MLVAARIFSPKVPKERDANVSQDSDGLFRIDVRFRRSSGDAFRKQARGFDTKTAARKKRDEFYEEFNDVLLGGGLRVDYFGRTITVDQTLKGHARRRDARSKST